MSPSSSSPSSSRTWVYDVFPSFSGEDVRITFLSHFLKELDRKLITAFKDNEIQRSQSIGPELVQAIRDSRIAVVVFSRNYASSSWCLNELLEIVRCKEEFGQMVIPVFYGLDPSHVRKQTGDFGKIFQETCQNQTEEKKILWREALTNVANILGYHSVMWGNEANMIEEIANDVLDKLLIAPSKDSEFVGIENHIANMSVLLQLESEEVKMIGLWGSSGIGKTTIARTLFNRLHRHFRGRVFIDRAFVSKSMEIYSRANPDDYNMKLHLQRNFLSEILGKHDIHIDRLGAVGEKLNHQKVLIFVDDLDDQVVLDALVGQIQWFGSGSRIIVVTNDKHFLRAHGIDHIYEVCLPSDDLALAMLCQSAFRKNYPPEGFEKLVVEVARHAGKLPLGLNVLGSSLRGRDKEYWTDMLPRLQNGLDGKIDKTLRVSYDGLSSEEDKAIFRIVACLFNGAEVTYIKLLLADSNLGVNIGLQNLADKSLIHVRHGRVEMHCLLQEMGRKIVRTQFIDEPEKREFLVDSKDICDVLNENIGTKKLLGISLDIDEIDELHVHENAFKGMRNLWFLKICSKRFRHLGKEGILQLPKSFDYLPPRLKLLCWSQYPMRCMPSKFRPENLVKLEMRESNLEKLWGGVVSLPFLKEMDLGYSHNLKEIPNLSIATNLETLNLGGCCSFVELPSSIRNLNKLKKLKMSHCYKLETLPTGINLKSLDHLDLRGCHKLRIFPEISANISVLYMDRTSVEEFPSNMYLENLVELRMENMNGDQQWEGMQLLTPFMMMLSPTLTELTLGSIPNLVELPSSIQYLYKLKELICVNCRNLEILPTGINLKSLDTLILSGCSQLKTFPDISTNISYLNLNETGIEEVPWWIEKFSRFRYLYMQSCSKLEYINLNLYKLTQLKHVVFTNCGALAGAALSGYPRGLAVEADNIDTGKHFVKLDFRNCFKLDPEGLLHQRAVLHMILSGEEVPSYFTYRTTGTSSSLTNIHLPHTSLPQTRFKFRVCAAVIIDFMPTYASAACGVGMHLECWFKDILRNVFYSSEMSHTFHTNFCGGHLFIWDCWIHVDDNNPLALDYVDMKLHMRSHSQHKMRLKEWGIRVHGDFSSPETRLVHPNTLLHFGEADEDNMVSETDQSEECEDSDDSGSSMGSGTDQSEECEDSDDNDGGNETDHTETCDAETKRCSKRMRIT